MRFIATIFRWLVLWPLGAGLVYLLVGVSMVLPVSVSSFALGWFIASIAPWTPWHGRAVRNLTLALPKYTRQQRQQILRRMWWNLGRNLGEYIHSARLSVSGRVTLKGDRELLDNLPNLLAKGGFVISAHLGNWELGTAPLMRHGIGFASVYRKLNNPLVDGLLQKRLRFASAVYAKGMESARGIVEVARKKQVLTLVVDQKLREGLAIPFFGRLATTPVSYIKTAIKYNLPIILIRVERTRGCNFIVHVSQLNLAAIIGSSRDSGEANQRLVATAINAEIENWIRQTPAQWFWPHRRWPESKGEAPLPAN